MVNRNALIVGASGYLGGLLLKELLDDPLYSNILIWVRKKLAVDHPKLTQIEIDFEMILEQTSPFSIDDVFCALGTTIGKAKSKEAFKKVDYTYVCNTAQWAADHQVMRFLVVSAMGSNPNSAVLYSQAKGEMEQTITALQIPSIFIFRPSLLLGRNTDFRFGEAIGGIFIRIASIFLWGKLRKYRGIQGKAVVNAIIQTAKSDQMGINIIDSDQMAQMYKSKNHSIS